MFPKLKVPTDQNPDHWLRRQLFQIQHFQKNSFLKIKLKTALFQQTKTKSMFLRKGFQFNYQGITMDETTSTSTATPSYLLSFNQMK